MELKAALADLSVDLSSASEPFKPATVLSNGRLLNLSNKSATFACKSSKTAALGCDNGIACINGMRSQLRRGRRLIVQLNHFAAGQQVVAGDGGGKAFV